MSTGLIAAMLAGAVPAQAAGTPTEYTYEREWIYSTDASEVPDTMGIDAQGRVFLVSNKAGYGEDDSRMRVYDGVGNLLTTWDLPVNSVGSIDFDAAGNLLLTDYFGSIVDDINSSVQVWTPTGTLLATYYVPAQNNTAGTVARAADNTLWVTDPTTDVIRHFSATGVVLGQIGGTGTAPGQLDSPWDLDILPDGNLVVADRENDRVQVLTPAGAPVTAWGQAGSGSGQFVNGPGAIEVRSDGYVYVADSTSRVQVFTATGQFVGLVPATTKRGGAISPITELKFAPDGSLYASGKLYPFENGAARYVPGVPPGPPAPPTPPSAVGTAGVKATKKPVKVAKGKLAVTVACSTVGPCTGQLRISVKGKALTRPATYSLATGEAKRVKVKVTRKGLRLVPGRGSVKAKVKTADSTTVIRVRR